MSTAERIYDRKADRLEEGASLSTERCPEGYAPTFKDGGSVLFCFHKVCDVSSLTSPQQVPLMGEQLIMLLLLTSKSKYLRTQTTDQGTTIYSTVSLRDG